MFLAAVGELMTEVGGEVADGVIIHGFTTERYVKEVTVPAIERGLAKAGRSRADFEISGPLFVVTGTNEEEFATAKQAVQQQIAFYGSTPAYRGGARAARLGRSAAGAQHACRSRASG